MLKKTADLGDEGTPNLGCCFVKVATCYSKFRSRSQFRRRRVKWGTSVKSLSPSKCLVRDSCGSRTGPRLKELEKMWGEWPFFLPRSSSWEADTLQAEAEVKKLGAALAKHNEQEEDEVLRHLWLYCVQCILQSRVMKCHWKLNLLAEVFDDGEIWFHGKSSTVK